MEASPTTAAPPAPTPTRKGRFMRVFYGVIAVIMAGIGLLRLVDAFTLPSCTSTAMRETIVTIGKEKSVTIADLTNIRSREGNVSETQCSATMVVDDGKNYAIDYRAFWEGWSAKIIIDKVEPI
jgi:hypothetical protein